MHHQLQRSLALSSGPKLRPYQHQSPARRPYACKAIESEELIQVGVIGGTHGVRGEVRVRPTSDFAEERLGAPGKKWIQQQAGGLAHPKASPLRQLESLGGRPHVYKGHSLWILRFKDIQSCEEAAVLNGCQILVHPEERAELPQDEYYIQQLIGMKVIQKEDLAMIGHVESVYLGNGAPDILLINQPQQPRHKPLLLPFVSEFVPVVDLTKRELQITPPEGATLIDCKHLKEMPRSDVIRKFIRAGVHLGHSAHAEGAVKRDYLQNVEHIARSRYETLYAVQECFRQKQPFCVIEEGKKDLALSKRAANIILAYKTIKVRP